MIINERIVQIIMDKTFIILRFFITLQANMLKNLMVKLISKIVIATIMVVFIVSIIRKMKTTIWQVNNPTRELNELNNKFFIINKVHQMNKEFAKILGKYIVEDIYSKDEETKEKIYRDKMMKSKQQNFIVESDLDIPETMWQQKIKFEVGQSRPRYTTDEDGNETWTVFFKDTKELIEKVKTNINSKSPINKK